MKKVFFWLHQGRLGNLIFQYQAVQNLSGDAWVVALDSEFFDMFERSPRFFVIPCGKRWRRYVSFMWRSFLELCTTLRLVGLIEPERRVVLDSFTSETDNILRSIGMLGAINVIKGFYHTSNYSSGFPKIKSEYVDEAERCLRKIEKAERVAVHIRFGDFLQWPVFGVAGAACLPVSYYLEAMRIIEENVRRPHFLIFSDDPARAMALLAGSGEYRQIEAIHSKSAINDFTMIKSCSHAIVSASSFSWWAAIMIENPGKKLIAPEYWLGFRRQTWYPYGIKVDQFHYVNPVQKEL